MLATFSEFIMVYTRDRHVTLVYPELKLKRIQNSLYSVWNGTQGAGSKQVSNVGVHK